MAARAGVAGAVHGLFGAGQGGFPLFRRQHVGDALEQGLVGGIAVLAQGRLVGGQDAQGLLVEHRQRDRVLLEHQPEQGLALAQLGDVDDDADDAAVGQAPVLGADPAAIGQGLLVDGDCLGPARHALGHPGVFAAHGLTDVAVRQVVLDHRLEGGAHAQQGRARAQVGVGAVPKHEAVLGVEHGQAFADGFEHRLQQAVGVTGLVLGRAHRAGQGAQGLGLALGLGAQSLGQGQRGYQAHIAAVLDRQQRVARLGQVGQAAAGGGQGLGAFDDDDAGVSGGQDRGVGRLDAGGQDIVAAEQGARSHGGADHGQRLQSRRIREPLRRLAHGGGGRDRQDGGHDLIERHQANHPSAPSYRYAR